MAAPSDFGDSQITLVNAPADAFLELVLEKHTVMNTRLLVDGRPQYKIATVDASANLTNVSDLSTNAIVATSKRRTFGADKVKFAQRFGGKSVKKDGWMAQGKLPSGQNFWTINSESGTFLWNLDVDKRLVLTAENAPEFILAYVKDESPIFALMVRREAEQNLDEIILAFVILEQRLRMEKKRSDVAGGRAHELGVEAAFGN